jgi:SMI1 / KNR4 family (SUKH-1)
MDWASIFDEAYPEPGAPEAMVAQFVATIGETLSAVEIRKVNAGQTNPFPRRDLLFNTWRPFDAAAWSVPDRPLPASYLSFLRWSNGGEFRTGERWFQFFPTLDPGHGVRAMLLAYHIPQYMPGALPIAFNGGGMFYLFDMRQPAAGDEYPVVCAHSGNLRWNPAACRLVANSFEEACRGARNVDDLFDDDA